MATSNSTNFTQTRDELILDALMGVGIYGIGETVSAEDNAFCVRALNKMIKAWGTDGLHLWCKEEGILFLQPKQEKYTFGQSTSTDYCAKSSDVKTRTLTASHAAAATTLNLDSSASMTVADKIGIVLSDKTIQWTTIATIPTTTSVTITTALTGAANDNALVYVFTNKINKPQRMLDMRRRTGYNDLVTSASSTELDINLSITPNNVYRTMPVKTAATGDPVQAYYQPNNTTGDLYLWPRPVDGSTRIVFSYERILEDMDTATNDFDFPPEWCEALDWQLRVRLCRPFGKASALQDILPIATMMYDKLLSWDSEVTSVTFEPDIEDYEW